MPLFEYQCGDCNHNFEHLVMGNADDPVCPACGGKQLARLLSAHSAASGPQNHALPGPGDTACCGSTPGHAGCQGPGSCCGRGPN